MGVRIASEARRESPVQAPNRRSQTSDAGVGCYWMLLFAPNLLLRASSKRRLREASMRVTFASVGMPGSCGPTPASTRLRIGRNTSRRTFRGGKREAEDALARFVQEVAGGHRPRGRDGRGPGPRGSPSPSGTCPPRRSWGTRPASSAMSPRPWVRSRSPPRARRSSTSSTPSCGAGRAGRQPLATATVRQVHAILRRALQQGVKWGWIDANPAVLATPPRVRNRVIEPPSPRTSSRLVRAARDGGSRPRGASAPRGDDRGPSRRAVRAALGPRGSRARDHDHRALDR